MQTQRITVLDEPERLDVSLVTRVVEAAGSTRRACDSADENAHSALVDLVVSFAAYRDPTNQENRAPGAPADDARTDAAKLLQELRYFGDEARDLVKKFSRLVDDAPSVARFNNLKMFLFALDLERRVQRHLARDHSPLLANCLWVEGFVARWRRRPQQA